MLDVYGVCVHRSVYQNKEREPMKLGINLDFREEIGELE